MGTLLTDARVAGAVFVSKVLCALCVFQISQVKQFVGIVPGAVGVIEKGDGVVRSFPFFCPSFPQVEQLESIVPGLRAANTNLEHAKTALQTHVDSLKLELRQQGERMESERQNLSAEFNEMKTRFFEKQGKLETTIENLRARSVEDALARKIANAHTHSLSHTTHSGACALIHNTNTPVHKRTQRAHAYAEANACMRGIMHWHYIISPRFRRVLLSVCTLWGQVLKC